MLNELQEMACGLGEELRGFDPDRVTTTQAAAILEAAAEVERLAGSVKVLVASRASQSRRWAAEGHRSAASWMAQKSKTSYGDAISTLETSERLNDLTDTTEALRNGSISRHQAKEVAHAASADPTAQKELLKVASAGTMKSLKERARHVLARAASRQSEVDRYRAVHRSRYLRHWSDADGAFRLDARLTPDSGARLVASIQAEADAIFARARASGEKEPPHAYRADALVALVTDKTEVGPRSVGSRKGGTGTDSIVIRVDAGALRRGYVEGAETCEVAGVGPVPVATAERILGNGFVKILVRDGVDVATVCHVGRTVPTHVQSALEERDPECVVPDCEVTNGLQNHHWRTDYVESQTTSLAELARICKRHHDLVTYDHHELTGGPGAWIWRAPAEVAPADTS